MFRGAAMGARPGNQSTYDSALSFLKQLNTRELQDLHDDTVKLNKLVDDLELVKLQESEKETLLASNKSIAEYNLSLEPRLLGAKQLLAETYQQGVKVQKEFDANKLKLDSSSSGTSLDTTLALLQTEAAKSEEESEACAESFLSQPSDTEEFVQRYIHLRSVAHQRKTKAEKMAEMLREQERQRSVPSSSAVPAVVARPAPLPPAAIYFNGYGAAGPAAAPAAQPPYPINTPMSQYPLPQYNHQPQMMMPTPAMGYPR